MGENVTLRPAQRKAIRALLTGTVEDAAKAANRTTRTIYRWLREPAFREALTQLEAEAMAQLSRSLVRLSEKSVKVIEDKLNAGELRAADVNLKHLLKYIELTVIERQIAELEQERKEWKSE